MTDKGEVEKVVEEVYNKHNRIDILICNAGNTTMPVFTTEMTMEDWDSVIKTHLYGTFNCVQACGEKMKEKR